MAYGQEKTARTRSVKDVRTPNNESNDDPSPGVVRKPPVGRVPSVARLSRRKAQTAGRTRTKARTPVDTPSPADSAAMLDALALGPTFKELRPIDQSEPIGDVDHEPFGIVGHATSSNDQPDRGDPTTDHIDLAASLVAHLVAFERVLAPRLGLPVPPRPPELSDELCERIERGAREAAAKAFAPDPLFGSAVSHLVSLGASLQRRDGHVAHRAMVDALRQNPNLRVISDRKSCSITVTKSASKAAGDVSFSVCQALNYPPDKPTGRVIVDDLFVIDRSRGRAIAIESKRGGQLGRDKRDSMVQDVKITALLLQAHLGTLNENVMHGEAHVLVHHDDRGLVLPDGMAITVDDLDERFGTTVRATTEAAQRYHAALVRRAMLPALVGALTETMASLLPPASQILRFASGAPPGDGTLPSDGAHVDGGMHATGLAANAI